MKYKVGDKVRVRKDLISGTWFLDCLVTRDMCEMGGKEAVIIMARGSSYFLSTKGTQRAWTDDMLEPVPDDSPDDADVPTIKEPDVRFPAFQEDNVNHPQHYKHGEIETLDIIRMSLTAEEFQGFLKGNVLKYQIRAPHKHETPDEDYKKAKFYYNLLEADES
jgi:hypothetical protein